jgi:threonine dehydrogenase-like Zn-dependent dehydrogenase
LPNIGSLVVLDPHVKINRTSGFGELVVASGSVENLAKAFIEIPTTAINERFVFTEPLACAHHCVANLLKYRQAKNLNGLSVSIVGAGMTGTLIGLLCRYYGATITIVNRSAERLGFLAGTSVFSKDELSLINEVNREFDVVIPTTTFLFPEILEFCEKAVKESGAILLYGGTKAGDVFPSTDNVDIDKIRRTQQTEEVSIGKKNFHLCGTHGATTEDFKTVVKLLKDHPSVLPVERLISRRIKLDEVPRVLVEMTTNEIPGKIIVDF